MDMTDPAPIEHRNWRPAMEVGKIARLGRISFWGVLTALEQHSWWFCGKNDIAIEKEVVVTCGTV